MLISREKLAHITDMSSHLAAASKEQIEESDYETEDLPVILSNIADEFRQKGQSHALLGEQEQAREAYRQAANYCVEFVEAMREHRDVIRDQMWEDAPAGYTEAMWYVLISRDTDLCEDIAAETLELDDSYLSEFGETDPDSAVRYFNAKVLAAAILDHERFEELAGKLDRAIELSVPADVREQKYLNSDFEWLAYSAIYEREADPFVDNLDKFLQGRAHNTSLDTDDPDELVDDEVTALCLLANDKGINVTIDSPYVPAVLVPDPATAEYVIEVDAGK